VMTGGGIVGGLNHALNQRKLKQGEVNLTSSCFKPLHSGGTAATAASVRARRGCGHGALLRAGSR
jgi:hypothetical protein